ncbi:hypothetical protein Ahy_B04g072932 [Arachis hypogaea]|uniref:Helitron helicase-like domain-containing protein n=1 Tax=Arachis hypogaea TaxID=3818 RepID=A0A444ZPA2_ARAHY|nr:hypothetical protein Ahy_B04g072932 [Arachis hypogaea]
MDDLDESKIYDPLINLFNQVGSIIDHPLFLQSKVQGCLDIGDPNYECSICGPYFWLLEYVERDSRVNHPIFTICCSKRRIQLPYPRKSPKNIRSYNSMFAFTSLGGKVLESINDGSVPPQFIITTQNYHRIGNLLLHSSQKPKFAQLYIYFAIEQTSDIDKELITKLLQMIDTHNVIAQSFRRVREFYQYHLSEIFSLKLYSQRTVDRRTYNAPSCDEVAALIVGDFDSSDHGRDIIYPLLFPYGEDDYQLNIPCRGEQHEYVPGRRIRVSLREFICFRLQIREQEDGIIHKCRRLFQ